MTTRWLAPLGFALLLAGPAVSADDKPTAKDLLKQAVEAANKDDLARAITLSEQALKGAPDDREALYLLAVLASARTDEVKDKAERIALFRKSSAAVARLREKYKDLQPQELDLATKTQLGEARALALEGNAAAALATIKAAFVAGFDDLDAVESDPDLEPIRKLPAFKEGVTAGIKEGVAAALAKAKPFPFDFDLKDLEGKAVALSGYKGKVTIVDIWGTWCPPCRLEIPHFVALYKDYKAKGLEIVGINCNEDGTPAEVKKTIKDFTKEQKVEYKCLLNDDKTESKIPEFQGYPTTLFLDRAGKVRLMLVGYTSKPRLEAIVTTLLAEPAKP